MAKTDLSDEAFWKWNDDQGQRWRMAQPSNWHALQGWRGCREAAEAEIKQLNGQIDKLDQMLELAWGLIANAHRGEWDEAALDWKVAAGRWRDEYFENMKTR